jgi:capsule biosynthesis phosphatase
MEKYTFVVDIDDTICVSEKIPGTDRFDYSNSIPIQRVVQKIVQLKEAGHRIILFTARGMRTYNGDVELIKKHVQPVLEDWLYRHGVPYDELHVGKPWGPNVYYVDDKALSPSDFVGYSIGEYQAFTEFKKIKP